MLCAIDGAHPRGKFAASLSQAQDFTRPDVPCSRPSPLCHGIHAMLGSRYLYITQRIADSYWEVHCSQVRELDRDLFGGRRVEGSRYLYTTQRIAGRDWEVHCNQVKGLLSDLFKEGRGVEIHLHYRK